MSGVDVHENDNDNDDERFFKDNFEKFYFPYANKEVLLLVLRTVWQTLGRTVWNPYLEYLKL